MFKTLNRFLAISGSNRKGIIASFRFSFLQSAFEVMPVGAIILMVAWIIDDVGGQRVMTRTDVWGLFAFMLISLAGRIIFGQMALKARGEANYRLFADRRLHIGDLLKKVPLGYFNHDNLGEITAAVTTTMTDVENVALGMLDKMISGLAHTTVIILFLMLYDWRTGLIALGGLATSMLIHDRIQKASAQLAPRRQAAQAGLAAAALEYVRGLAVVKAFGLERRAGATLTSAIAASRETNVGLERGLNWLTAVYQLIFKVAATFVLSAAGLFFMGGRIGLPQCVFLMIASFMIFAHMEVMGSVSAVLRLVEASLDRLEKVEAAPLMPEGRRENCPASFDLEFRNVSFGYDDRPVLNQVSFCVPHKSRTAVVGPSGSGKTTICNLIARFRDVDQGQILLGGLDLREYSGDGLLRNISMVFQNVYLFNDTIKNNILFGRPGADTAEIASAARRASCHDFIEKLPDGYDTVVGEGGASLSGGERQRISIARAILKDAPIVILDEATASIDPENELIVQAAIDELTRSKTVITIAHRLNTVRQADQILVLDQGRIVQRGRHESLMAEPDGLYRRFVNARSQAVNWTLA